MPSRQWSAAIGIAVLLLFAVAGCRGGESGSGGTPTDTSAAARAAYQVRGQYTADDAVASGAWTWTSPAGVTFVLVDVQSTLEGVVQARADLWGVDDRGVVRLGRSDVMPSVAEIIAFGFEDVTGDGVPDLLGYVADSAGTGFPVFMVGASGTIADGIETAAPGFRFSVDPVEAPQIVRGTRRACAVRLWALDPVPDSSPAGWRYLPLLRSGALGPPEIVAPDCP